MNESKQRKLGVVLSYVSIVVNTLIQLLYTPFLIHMLGQSEYGLYSLVSSIIGYLAVLDLGFGNAIIVYTSKYKAQGKTEEEKKLHGMFFYVFCIIAVICIILGLILYFSVDSFFANTMTFEELSKAKIMMLILTFNLAITFVFNIFNSIISAYERFAYQKIIALIGTILKPLIMIPLLFMGYRSITMIIVLTVVNIIIVVSNYLFCKYKLNIHIKYSGFDNVLFKTILGYSIWIFIGTIVDKVNWSVDHFILGAVSGTIAVSVYSVASTLNIMFINLSTAISSVLLPKMSKLVAKNVSTDELTDEMIKVGRIQNYVLFLMCSGLILFGKMFINLWVGEGFEDSYWVALLLIIPVCVPLIQNLGLSIMQAMNKFKFKSISTVIMAVINVFVSIYLAKKWGAIGAAIGTCGSLIICNIIVINIYYYKSLGLDVIRFWKNIFRQIIPFVIPVGIIILFMHFVSLNGWKGFIVYGCIYTIIYMIVAYYLSMNKYEKDLINRVLIKLRLKRS